MTGTQLLTIHCDQLTIVLTYKILLLECISPIETYI